MKSIVLACIFASYLIAVASGVYMVAPTTRKNCEPSDYRFGVDIIPLDCTYTVDQDTPPNFSPFYAIGECDSSILNIYSCNTPDLCYSGQWNYCSTYSNISLGCDSIENIFLSCYNDYTQILELLGTKSLVQRFTSNIPQCQNVYDIKAFPINKCITTLRRDEFPSVLYKCNTTHVTKFDYTDDFCRELSGVEYYPTDICLAADGITSYTCQGY